MNVQFNDPNLIVAIATLLALLVGGCAALVYVTLSSTRRTEREFDLINAQAARQNTGKQSTKPQSVGKQSASKRRSNEPMASEFIPL